MKKILLISVFGALSCSQVMVGVDQTKPVSVETSREKTKRAVQLAVTGLMQMMMSRAIMSVPISHPMALRLKPDGDAGSPMDRHSSYDRISWQTGDGSKMSLTDENVLLAERLSNMQMGQERVKLNNAKGYSRLRLQEQFFSQGLLFFFVIPKMLGVFYFGKKGFSNLREAANISIDIYYDGKEQKALGKAVTTA